MKKTISTILLAVVLLGGIAGCSGSGSNQQTDSTGTSTTGSVDSAGTGGQMQTDSASSDTTMTRDSASMP